MDNPYAQKYASQYKQRNTILASPSGNGRRRKPKKNRKDAGPEPQCIKTPQDVEQQFIMLIKRNRIKLAVSLGGVLTFGLLLVFLLSMAIHFPIPFIQAFPENNHILYSLGRNLKAFLFPADWFWSVAAIISIVSLYAVPFLLCGVIGMIVYAFPASYIMKTDHLFFSASDYISALDSLRDKNNALSFRIFARPVEWIIAVLIATLAAFSYRWICIDAGTTFGIWDFLCSWVCIFAVFALLHLPSRYVNHLLYGTGCKKRSELYARSLVFWKSEQEDEKRRDQLSKLLRKAVTEEKFDLFSLPHITCPDDVKPWIEIAHKYGFYHTHFSGFRLMRMALLEYENEHYEKKRAEEEARRKQAEEETKRKREEEKAQRKRADEEARRKRDEEEALVIANVMERIRMDQFDKGLKTYMTDTRNGDDIYFKNGEYVNGSGERVPLQWIDE